MDLENIERDNRVVTEKGDSIIVDAIVKREDDTLDCSFYSPARSASAIDGTIDLEEETISLDGETLQIKEIRD